MCGTPSTPSSLANVNSVLFWSMAKQSTMVNRWSEKHKETGKGGVGSNIQGNAPIRGRAPNRPTHLLAVSTALHQGLVGD